MTFERPASGLIVPRRQRAMNRRSLIAGLGASIIAPREAWALLQVNQLNGFNVGETAPPSPFPQVAASNTSTASTTSQTVNLPAGIASGQLLIAIVSLGQATTVTWPAGWTELHDNNGQLNTLSAAYRIADGSEGASITVTIGTTAAAAHYTARITGAHASAAPEVGTAVFANSSTSNPPSKTASWGSDDNLWIAYAGLRDGGALSSYPTDYTLNQANNAGPPRLAVGMRELATNTTDPGSFTWGVSDRNSAQTMVVRPA